MNFREDQFVLIFANNKNAIDFIINSLYHKRTKHIKMRWHWIKEMMNRRKIILRYLLINEMIANGLIKSFSASVFEKFKRMLNLSHWLIKMIIILMKNHHNDQVKMLNWDVRLLLRDRSDESLGSRSKSISNRIKQQSRSLLSKWWFWNNQKEEKHFSEDVNSIY